MAADVVPYFRPYFTDLNGKPLAGGKIYTYKAGTTSLIATYKDANYTPNTNPIILDSSGCADIFVGIQALKFVIHDENDVLIKTIDGVSGAGGTAVGIQTVVPIVTDGEETTFALGVDAELPQNCIVVVDPTEGERIVYMTDEYTIDGQNLVFDSAPPAGVGEIRVGHTRAIGSSGLSDGVVTTSKLQDNAVTNAKLADNSVGASKMQNDSVGTSKIQDEAVTLEKMAEGSVDTPQLVNGAVELIKMMALIPAPSAPTPEIFTVISSNVDVWNLSRTITAIKGKTRIAFLCPDYSSSNLGGITIAAETGEQWASGEIRLKRGSQIIGKAGIGFQTNINLSSISGSLRSYKTIPPFILFVDNDTNLEGEVTYQINATLVFGAEIVFRSCRLVVVQL